MKLNFYVLFFALLCPTMLVGQAGNTISYQCSTPDRDPSPSSNGATVTLSYSATSGGRHSYRFVQQSSPLVFVEVIYRNARWEIHQFETGGSPADILWFRSDVQSTPNPPNLSFGTWKRADGITNHDMGGFSNTGTQGVLPIELTQFDVQNTEGSKTNLTWATASETNNKGFDIERSRDGENFQTIGNVKGIGKAANYNFVDANPFNGVNYYRLKQVDFDGTETLSKVVSVTTTGKGTSKIKIFPTNTEGSVSIESGQWAVDNVQVFNNVGQLVLSSGATSRLDLSAMPSGLYLVQVKAGGVVATEKVFKK